MPYLLHTGDSLEILKTLESESVDCCVTSPPYFHLRDYCVPGQIGLESTPEIYTNKLVSVFQEVKRILKPAGSFWLNLGDTYSKSKELIGIPWRVALALKDDGWILRNEIIWSKTNPLPEPVKDRCSRAHEQIFFFVKQSKYFYNQDAVRTPHTREWHLDAHNEVVNNPELKSTSLRYRHGGKKMSESFNPLGANRKDVWSISLKPFPGAHVAVMPFDIPEICIKAGCPEGGTVLDPFSGAATTGVVALRLGRSYIGIDLNPEYQEIAESRLMDLSMSINHG